MTYQVYKAPEKPNTKQNKQDPWSLILKSIVHLLKPIGDLPKAQQSQDKLAEQLERITGRPQTKYRQQRKDNEWLLGPMKINK